MRKIIILILALVFVAAACNKAADKSNNSQSAPTQDQSNVLSGSVSVTIDDNGFSPQEITVKKGTTVTFINSSSNPKWPASNPHPTHTDYPEFDPKQQGIVAGQTWSFTFDKIGTWKFHDHLNPARRGTITVVE
jgi:plastocyanin